MGPLSHCYVRLLSYFLVNNKIIFFTKNHFSSILIDECLQYKTNFKNLICKNKFHIFCLINCMKDTIFCQSYKKMYENQQVNAKNRKHLPFTLKFRSQTKLCRHSFITAFSPKYVSDFCYSIVGPLS